MEGSRRDRVAAALEIAVRVLADVDSVADVRVRRFKHRLACGAQGDPGPVDDFGACWHWCFAVYVRSEGVRLSVYGRADDVIGQLQGWRLNESVG